MRVRQYKLGRSVEDRVRETKTCWLDRLDLRVGDSITLESYPDWMWWDIEEVYDPIAESENVVYTRPEKKEEWTFDWIPMG